VYSCSMGVLKFEHGNYPMLKHLTLCVSCAVLQCLARLGWHQLQIRSDGIKEARSRVPKRSACVGCAPQMEQLFVCNA
jgi:hypothetical protein